MMLRDTHSDGRTDILQVDRFGLKSETYLRFLYKVHMSNFIFPSRFVFELRRTLTHRQQTDFQLSN